MICGNCTGRFVLSRFDPLLHDGRSRSDETRAGRLQTRQTGALSVRIVPSDSQVLGRGPVQATDVRRAETGVGRAAGESPVRGQLRGPRESRGRIGQ